MVTGEALVKMVLPSVRNIFLVREMPAQNISPCSEYRLKTFFCIACRKGVPQWWYGQMFSPKWQANGIVELFTCSHWTFYRKCFICVLILFPHQNAKPFCHQLILYIHIHIGLSLSKYVFMYIINCVNLAVLVPCRKCF